MGDLAARQAALVAALTGGAPVPDGFDARLVAVARTALLRKRAGDVARHWPMLAAGLGDRWVRDFAAWAAGRPTNGSLRDGWDFARVVLSRDPAAVPHDPAAVPHDPAAVPHDPAAVVSHGPAAARSLGPAAAEELAKREAAWVYDGVAAPRPRRLPAVRRTADAVIVQVAGRVYRRAR